MQDQPCNPYSMDHSDVTELLETVLTNSYFTFNDTIHVYRRDHGLAMVNSVSAILAILYMDYVEKKASNLVCNRIALYCRYVDDIFLHCKR